METSTLNIVAVCMLLATHIHNTQAVSMPGIYTQKRICNNNSGLIGRNGRTDEEQYGNGSQCLLAQNEDHRRFVCFLGCLLNEVSY